MEFREIQKYVLENAARYGKQHNVNMDEDFALLKLGEEFGEFMQAVLILRKQCREEKYVSDEEARAEVAKELADIVGMAIVAADRLGVDIEEALTEKWMKRVMNK
ncbi:MAG: hypothetical protein HOJ15_00195 [Candidatus Jacksonbacteria bacterium]|jgi:NTP pyrophosphatase (non-canonical NTP hydrolase)|nr:hypothetical protein [Candidatus Jacksonbacteria bacterium]MBT6757211.1 hypothetical protein [Candidatus Jacksonbacteria bacterium]